MASPGTSGAMDAERVNAVLAGLPHFGGAVVVDMPPDWRSGEPVPYTFVFATEELSAGDTREYVRGMARSGAPNPRLFTPATLALASQFHPLFWLGVAQGRASRGVPRQLAASRLLVVPTVQVDCGRYFLESLLFLTGVTLSAAVVQDRWSRGTLESKLSRLWQAGAMGESLDLPLLQALDLQGLVRSLASHLESPGLDLLLELKRAFAAALGAVAGGGGARRVVLSPRRLEGAMRERFGFVDALAQLLGSNLEAVIAYGSSVTSDVFADYDLIIVAKDPTAALERLAGKHPEHRGVELNVGVYGRTDFWTYQMASGDNLSSNALCLYGEVEVPEKPVEDLLARNYSFGFIRLRQLLGMATFATSHTLHTGDDDKRNLYGYFVKIPQNVAKGLRAAVGRPISKAEIVAWMDREIGYDVGTMVSWCEEGRSGDAIATAAWCTLRVMESLNEEHPAYEVLREPDVRAEAPAEGAP